MPVVSNLLTTKLEDLDVRLTEGYINETVSIYSNIVGAVEVLVMVMAEKITIEIQHVKE